MDNYLVYYAYYHNDNNAHEMSTNNFVENPDVKIAKVYASSHNEADSTCYDELNLHNSGYVITVIKI